MIISKTDYIPDKVVVSVIGPIEIKRSGPTKKHEGNVKDIMVIKAKEMGANAIINYESFDFMGIWENIKSRYKGTAVLVEDIRDYWKNQKCSNCGKPIKITSYFCGQCGAKQ